MKRFMPLTRQVKFPKCLLIADDHVDPVAEVEGNLRAVRRIFHDESAAVSGDPPLVAAVVLRVIGVHTVHITILRVILHADRVRAVTAHVLAPRGEAFVGGGHVSDERTARPRQRGGLEHLEVMLVGIAADALIAVLIRRNGRCC